MLMQSLTSSTKVSWLAVSVLAAGLIVGLVRGGWAGEGPRVLRDIDDVDAQGQPVRGDGWLLISKCPISLIDSVTLAADRPGVIAFVKPEEGDSVKALSQIVGLRDEAAAALLKKVATLKAENDNHILLGRAAVQATKFEWEHHLKLNRRVTNAVSVIEVDQSRFNHEKAVLQLKQAEYEHVLAKLEIEKAEEELKHYCVEAPFDGTVRRILKRKGEAVRQGDPIVELVSTRRVKVEGYLPIEDRWTVKPGDLVQIQIDIPRRDLAIEKEVFEGKVIFVDPTVSRVNQSCRVWAEIDNPGECLVESLYTKMKILYGQRSNSAANPTVARTDFQQRSDIK